MTAVCNTFNSLFGETFEIVSIYTVEVVKFNGDVETVEVEAQYPEQAQEIASELVDDADYTSIIACENFQSYY